MQTIIEIRKFCLQFCQVCFLTLIKDLKKIFKALKTIINVNKKLDF